MIYKANNVKSPPSPPPPMANRVKSFVCIWENHQKTVIGRVHTIFGSKVTDNLILMGMPAKNGPKLLKMVTNLKNKTNWANMGKFLEIKAKKCCKCRKSLHPPEH